MDLVEPFDIMMDHIHRMTLEIARNRNEFKEHGESFKAYLAAQEQTKAMQAHLDGLVKLIEPASDQKAEIQRHLKAIRDGLMFQHSHLDKLVRSVPPMARKPPNADELSGKVFAIPELLERILLYLTPADLLRIHQVNRQFFDAINASPKIQFKMGLRPQENCHIFFPASACEFNQFTFYSETYSSFTTARASLRDNEIVVRAGFYGADHKPPKLGERCRNVLLCQPPIKSLDVYTRCCRPTWSWSTTTEPAETISVDSGIRMGHLVDAYFRITAAHRLCPEADAHDHDDEGFVKPRVSFESRITVQNDDPALLDRKQHEKKRKEEETQWTSHSDRMRPYIAAKQSARDNGQAIPTLAEFDAANSKGAEETSADLPLSLGLNLSTSTAISGVARPSDQGMEP